MLRLAAEGIHVMSSLFSRVETGTMTYDEVAHAGDILGEVASYWLSHPEKLIEAQSKLFSSYLGLWAGIWAKTLGAKTEPVVRPRDSDKRFSDPEWSENPYFDFWKQAYLLTAKWSEALLDATELDEQRKRSAEFYVRFLMAALSPSNSALINPVVLREIMATNGANLVEGMHQLAADLEKPGDLPIISQTDTSAFEVGVNLAVTPGKVIFQNELFQLIQYAPCTDRVREIPLLITPPWINKYYILDLTPQKSFVKYAVEQGFTVFLISWVNPDARLADKSFEDYVSDGLLTAADVVTRETGIARCNVLGYCIGGTLLGTALAYLAALGEKRFASATFLTTQFDFTMSGDLSIFASDAAITKIEKLMAERGYLDSSRIAFVFNMMRSQDLIWPYVVNNYLLGKKPMPFDILYWNQDSTRMPAANHAFYLRHFYGANQLARGELTLKAHAPGRGGGTPPEALASAEDHIVFYLREKRGRSELPAVSMSLENIRLNLAKVCLPIYELAAKEDHIAPAASVFRGARLFGGGVTFVVAGSGHIAGVINPPAKAKYQYWSRPDFHAETFEEWIKGAEEQSGSWWPHWANWLAGKSGHWVDARKPGTNLGIIEDAPGCYVRSKS